MALFRKDKGIGPQGPSTFDAMKMAHQMQAFSPSPAMMQGGAAGMEAAMTWARRVLELIAPPNPGYVKRCSCPTCGAPKKLASVTAYVYCDYCGSLIDYDFRQASAIDTPPGM